MALLLGTSVPLVLATQSQTSTKVYRIGFLAFGHRPSSDPAAALPLATFRQALRELGYTEGRNLVIEERWAEARLNRLPVLAGELVQLRPDVIVASGASAVRVVKRATQHTPIFIAGAADPVAEGLVASLAHPDTNVTGVSVLTGRELEGKRLELLKEAVPRVTRVAVILDSTSRLDPAPLEVAARALGLTLLLSGETESPDEYRDAFAEMVRDGADAIYGSREFVEAGGLMAYGPNFAELFRRAAVYVDKILKGATPRDLPVEQPMHFELVINAKTMKALGLSFPPTILIGVDEVIQ
jgi:putative ABC transport system substrate-binding protein